MKNILSVIFILLTSNLLAQKLQPKFDCNTIFVCIDSADYEKLFSNPFIKDTLFFCRNSTTNTATDNYTGKYFIGKSATLEFINPSANNNFGDHLYDVGIEFKTRKLGLQKEFIANAKAKNINCIIDSTQLTIDSSLLDWYKTLEVKPSNKQLQISLLEYQKKYLESLGFTDEESNKSMSFEEFNNILSGGRKYPRQFNAIKSVSIRVLQKDIVYLQNTAKMLGLEFSKSKIFNKDFALHYQVVAEPVKTGLSSIEISLVNSLPKQNIHISKTISVLVNGNKAIINFNN
jgi:Family of unknown function (DUF5829)